MNKKCLLRVTVLYTTLALAVLCAILVALNFLLLHIYICSKKVGKNAGKISTDAGITFEGLMLYQKLHFGPVCGTAVVSLK